MPQSNYSGVGSAVGAGIGTAIMPGVGTAIGGALGGAVGGMFTSGSNPTPPPDLQQPVSPGAVSGTYGGVMRDPVTGLITYTNNDIGSGDYQSLMNNYLQSLAMGGNGAGVTNDLDAQIQFQQQLIDKLNSPQASGASNMDLSKFVPPGWVGPDGKLIDISNPNSIPRNSPVYQEFEQQTHGNYGSSNPDISFAKWVQDVYKRNIQPKLAEYQQAQKQVQGNQVVGGDALKAAQLKLQQLQNVKQQFTANAPGVGNNPILNYLNQPQNPQYQSDINRWTNQAGLDYNQMQQQATLPFNTPNGYTVSGFDANGQATGPNTYDFNASNNSTKYAGPTEGNYRDLDVNAAGALQGVYQRQAAADFQNANLGRDQNMANRGLLSSSVNEVGRAGDVARLADAQANARLQGLTAYNNTVGQNNTTAARRFQDQFNAAMAAAQANQWGANFNANLQNQQYGRAADMSNTGYARQNNEFNLKNQLQQQWRGNALQSLGVQGGLQNNLNALNQQNMQNRLGYAGFLSGQNQQAFNNNMAQQGFNLNQSGQGLGVNMNMAGQQTAANTANSQMQNSFNNAQNQQQGSNNQANQGFWSNLVGNASAMAMSQGNNQNQGTPTWGNQGTWGSIPGYGSAAGSTSGYDPALNWGASYGSI